MELLRKMIQNIILESEIPWTETPEGKEYLKYHDRDRAETAIKELYSIFEDAYAFEVGPWTNQFTVHEMKYKPEPGCVVRIRLYRMWDAITFDEIETTPKCEGKGYAREAIKIVKDVAKKHRILVRLEAKAFHTHKGENRMSSSQLESWYESQGFKKTNGRYMEYRW